MAESALTPEVAGERRSDPTRPVLSVVVPVYNQPGIVENVHTIRERIAAKLQEPFEVVVVSDGSLDRSEEPLVGSGIARVIRYDRNLGKGYAVKAGALAARGRWISFVDADLDLDPSSIPDFLELARRESLDFVIGSKRHSDSLVHYPRSRRVSSWLYQQLVRLLFRLDVKDTQVGLKLFRREVAEQVLPLLLVKQYAFDLEFLAVARSLGFSRIRELPVTLEYRFTGSGVRPTAVLLALIDTAAIFYRLNVLRYYRRKLELLSDHVRALDYRPPVSLVGVEPEQARRLEYPDLETVGLEQDSSGARLDAARSAKGELVAFVELDGVPAGNWLESTVPFLANPEIGAVVTATVTRADGPLLERGAAAVAESLLGGGSHYFRFTPGNLRFVRHFPATNIVLRRGEYLALDEREAHPHRLCATLAASGRRVLYTPESVVVTSRPPLFRPHLAQIASAGRSRGEEIRRLGVRGITAASVPPVALLAFALLGWPLVLAGESWRLLWAGAWIAYALALVAAASLAALRFQSLRVGGLALTGIVAVHVTFALGVFRGLFGRPVE